jgi:hypothetical protein
MAYIEAGGSRGGELERAAALVSRALSADTALEFHGTPWPLAWLRARLRATRRPAAVVRARVMTVTAPADAAYRAMVGPRPRGAIR